MFAIDNGVEIDALVSARAAARLRIFAQDVAEKLGPRLTRVVLFGSRARGDSKKSSDYDVAVFVESIDNRKSVDHMLSDIAYPHALRGIHIRPVALSAELFRNPSGNPLANSIMRDGIVLR